MGSLDFYVDFNIEPQNIGEEFNLEAEHRLRDLAAGHSDLVGASVSLENIVKKESPYLYQVRIVLYKRPEDIVVVEKGVGPEIALKGALDALEKKVRASREKLDHGEERQAGMNEAVFQELTAQEVYATFVQDHDAEKLLQKNRMEIASKLMVEEGLKQEVAYFAADQILRVAQKIASQQSKR
jgi:hypothetical protein